MRAYVVPACVLMLPAWLAGCALPSARPLDVSGLTAVRSQDVAVTARKKPGFTALTPGGATAGILGMAIGSTEGNRMIAAYDVPDPADAIARDLALALRDSQGSRTIPEPVAVESSDPAQIAAAAKGRARFVIDVETRLWMLSYFPTDWTHYQVKYSAAARLIDVDTATVQAEAGCKQADAKPEGAPTYDEMVSDRAARLKAELAGDAAMCAAQFRRDMFAMRDARPVPLPLVPAATPVAVAASAAPAPLAAPPAPAVNWTGVMACGARRDSGPNAAAYEARFAMEVQGRTVHAHRRTAEVEETLAGSIDHDRLELHGSGNRLADPGRKWRLDIGGAFAPGATTYVGTGSMRVGGEALRACELRMTRA